MPDTFRCPRGHAWSAANSAAADAANCPLCAAAGEESALDDAEALTEIPMAALPPAPPATPPAVAKILAELAKTATRSPRLIDPKRPVIPNYEILEQLGRGGMGIVYKARHLALNRIVALKLILSGIEATPESRSRFRNEARAVAQLHHANIVQIYDVGEHDGRPFIALEFVGGGTLADFLAGKPQPPLQAAALTETLAKALQHAHEHGMIHRDLKPTNVLLAPVDGEEIKTPVPKIADFGLAKRVDQAGTQTEVGAMVGTPLYMAPEQAHGQSKDLGPATDVHALGALLYEMLTGRPPFLGVSDMDTLQRVMSEEPVSPRRLQPHVSRDLETICLKCLEKSPARRYDTAEALAEDLRRFQANEPIRARPAGAWTRTIKWTRRKPARAVAIVLAPVAVAACITAGVGWYYNADLQKARRAEAEQRQSAESALAETRQANAVAVAARHDAETQKGQAEVARDEARRAHQSLREVTYLHAIAHADRQLLANQTDRAEELLDGPDCPPELRSWEWNYLKRLCRQEIRSLSGHRRGVLAVALSPDGKLLASGGLDQTVRIWNPATGKVVKTLFGHRNAILGLDFSPDGKLVASATGDPNTGVGGEIRVWDVATGEVKGAWIGHRTRIWQIAFRPNGRHLATASDDRTVKLWDVESRAPIRVFTGHNAQVVAFAFTSDGKEIASVSDRHVKLWDPDSGAEIWSSPKTPVVRSYGLAISPDDAQIGLANADGSIVLLDVKTGRVYNPMRTQHDLLATSVAFAPDGRVASASHDQTIRVWDPARREAITILRGHLGGVRRLAFSRQGNFLASTSYDGTVKIWNAGSGAARPALVGFGQSVHAPAFSADGGRIAFWVDAANLLAVHDTRTGQSVATWLNPGIRVQGLALNVDGSRLVAVGTPVGNATPRGAAIFDVGTRDSRDLIGHTKMVQSVALSADGRQVATAGSDQTIRVWDAETGKKVTVLQEQNFEPWSRAHLLAFDNRGTLLAAAIDNSVCVWDLTRRALIVRRFVGSSDRVTALAFSPNSLFVAWGTTSRAIRVTELVTGQTIASHAGHAATVSDITFTPDGSRLVSASSDHTVKHWNFLLPNDLRESSLIFTLYGHASPVAKVRVFPDGQRVISISDDGLVKHWDGRPPEKIAGRD